MRASSSPSISRTFAAGIGVAAALSLAACAGSRSIPLPNAGHLAYAEKGGYPATLPSLMNGRRLYVNRCSNCHTLYSPSAFPAREWPRLVREMQGNAEINEGQVQDISRYLLAVAAASQDTETPMHMGSPRDAPSAPASHPTRNSSGIGPVPVPEHP